MKLLEGTNGASGVQRGPNGPVGRVRVGKSTGGSHFSGKISLGVKTLFS